MALFFLRPYLFYLTKKMGSTTHEKWVFFLQNYQYNKIIDPVSLLPKIETVALVMDKENISQEEIRALADHVFYKNGLLIDLCDNILPEEEGRKNVHQRFVEREKLKRKAKFANLKHKFLRFFKT
jgi:hypothetical protein